MTKSSEGRLPIGLVTEAPSPYHNLEAMSIEELLRGINEQDQCVADVVHGVILRIAPLVQAIVQNMKQGGRLFYIGAGTSGRLGIVDASEIPPTFGMEFDRVIGLIAGGDGAIRRSAEGAEDDIEQGWKDLCARGIGAKDVVIGITASGRTPYVLGALRACRARDITTGCIVCNPGTEMARITDYPIEVIVGPEFVTGSTRMKAGTAQKLVLNMISTAVMITLGKVKGNRMIDMQPSNTKLIKRGTLMIVEATGLSYDEARALLLKHNGKIRDAIASAQGCTSESSRKKGR